MKSLIHVFVVNSSNSNNKEWESQPHKSQNSRRNGYILNFFSAIFQNTLHNFENQNNSKSGTQHNKSENDIVWPHGTAICDCRMRPRRTSSLLITEPKVKETDGNHGYSL